MSMSMSMRYSLQNVSAGSCKRRPRACRRRGQTRGGGGEEEGGGGEGGKQGGREWWPAWSDRGGSESHYQVPIQCFSQFTNWKKNPFSSQPCNHLYIAPCSFVPSKMKNIPRIRFLDQLSPGAQQRYADEQVNSCFPFRRIYRICHWIMALQPWKHLLNDKLVCASCYSLPVLLHCLWARVLNLNIKENCPGNSASNQPT